MTSKVFEEKTARDKAMAYDGNPNHGAPWRSDVYDYFVSKWPDCEPWLRWAEEQGATVITPESIDSHKRSGQAMTERPQSPSSPPSSSAKLRLTSRPSGDVGAGALD